MIQVEKFRRYPLEYDPLFKIKVYLSNRLSASSPLANLHWDKIERECVSDEVVRDLPTLEDLGITLTHMEDQVHYELRPWIHGLYYGVDADEPTPRAEPPKVVL